jgi:hypothetical protein
MHGALTFATLETHDVFKTMCRHDHGEVVSKPVANGADSNAVGLSRRRDRTDHRYRDQPVF